MPPITFFSTAEAPADIEVLAVPFVSGPRPASGGAGAAVEADLGFL